MENIPIAILPEMFEFYISFLNTEKVMGLKCSLFIAENATKEFEMQRYIIDVFDNCMESGLCENGIALCYSIKYFTISYAHGTVGVGVKSTVGLHFA